MTLHEVAQRLADIAARAATPADVPAGDVSPPDRLACDLLQVIRQQVAGVAHLAQTQPAAHVAGLTLARAAFEQALRVLWLLAPADAAGRTGRWSAFLKAEAKHWKRAAKELEQIGRDAARVRAREQVVETLRESAAEAGAAKRGKKPKAPPEPRKILKELGLRGQSVPYLLSDPTAALASRSAESDASTLHDEAGNSAAAWYLPLMLAWLALRGARSRAAEVGAIGVGGWEPEQAQALTRTLHALAHVENAAS